MDGYQTYDATGLAELIRSGEVKPDEVLQAAKQRAAEVNPKINAIVADIDPAPAVEGPDAPFSGVPFLIKDLHQDLAGYPTSSGSRSLAKVPAAETATVVQRWLDAGLVIFGKTNTPEFGAKGVTEPVLFGPARNPWNTEHTPGGSSGGAAAAVAAGIVPCAGASDGGGSIRIPASACGLFGLKASRGLIPSGPVHGEPLGGTATDGVISRSVRDSAAMLDVLTGPTPVSPYLPANPPGSYADEVGRDPGRLRIGVCTDSSINPTPHPEALAAVTAAATVLTELGHDVVELARAPHDDTALAKDFLTSWFVYCAFSVDEAKAASGSDDSGFELDTRLMASLGRATNPVELTRAIEHRHEHVRRLAEFHESHDLLLTPTTATPPPRIGAFDISPVLRLAQQALLTARAASLLRHTPIVDQLITENLGWVPYTQLANLTGRPAMSVPLHWTPDGLPIGVQFVGRLGADGQLLRLAAQLEQARPWADRRPVL
ncbi:amidase [Mycobacterium kubicae]|uniref:amidase n=1 Tax=Mycobacterium kubicae TaxID=120959 RepID=A0AAX1J6U0_9MYCO|nr:amidase [Mycobacterium kubicae]MCV7094175.1 amidase [Mycobacterium kubicae]ORV98512.1 amidase [Mycobacterium kubicae]QNI12608.1 amidase [Mycobacterium kubicae]QPI36131.1 amidase [Mycobacterium kubicae]GFG68012.1 amidase [Mycobacterium kubicae]